MSHIVLLPFGTFGSLHPFIWLGRLLHERGHRVTVVSAGMYEGVVVKAGLEFESTRDTVLEEMLACPALWEEEQGPRVAYEHAGRATAGYVDAVERIIARDGVPHLLLAPMVCFGARLLREKHGIPLITVHLYPLFFMSAHAVPWMSRITHRLRRLPLWLRHFILNLGNPLDRLALRHVWRCCRAHGVPRPLSLWRQWRHSPDGALALFPDWFEPPRPDWPPQALSWDFPLEDMASDHSMEPGLERFLAAGEAPVVFTAGSGQLHAAEFFRTAAELARQCGCRAVLVIRKPDLVPAGLAESVYVTAYAPFSALLPRARALVHHGGIGTLSLAFAAGVPQMVVPMALDQMDNAERVELLGAGVWLPAAEFSVEKALPLLRRCFEEGIRSTAAALAGRFSQRRAPDELLRWIESRRVPAQVTRVLPPDATTPPVFLIPGLGADSRTFRGPWLEIPGARCVEWPEYHGEASLPAVARFVAAAWQIPDGAVLVATSFGGAVACEIARLRRVRAVVLVASSPRSEDFRTVFRMRVLTRLTSLRLTQRLMRQRSGLSRQECGRSPTPFRLALLDSVDMFSVCQADFYRAMFDALAKWPGCPLPADTPVLRIHGRRDSQVRCPAGADLELDGGHLIVMTHARECVDLIQRALPAWQAAAQHP